MYRTLFSAALIIACTAMGAGAETWYVLPDGSGRTPTIQSAVDSAAASGDAIMIKGGVYYQGGIIVDGKNIMIDQYEGQVYLIAPSAGTGACFTIRDGAAGEINSLAIRGFDTAIAVENGSPTIQWITLKACSRGAMISGTASAPKIWYSVVDSCATGIEVSGGSVTLQNQTIVNCMTGALFSGGSTTFSRTIVDSCSTGVQCSGGSATLSCNDFFLNATNYSGCAAGANDFYTDPKFCFWKSTNGPYWLHDTSPCFTKANPCAVRVGAFTASPGCTGTAVQQSSWGEIKAIYR